MDIGLDSSWISAQCPRCHYEVEFTFLQARLQETVICPCCKVNIHLTDIEASAEGSKREVDVAMRELEKTLKGLSKTIRIRL
jgi:transcription initiation factor IIE alpha subunit